MNKAIIEPIIKTIISTTFAPVFKFFHSIIVSITYNETPIINEIIESKANQPTKAITEPISPMKKETIFITPIKTFFIIIPYIYMQFNNVGQ